MALTKTIQILSNTLEDGIQLTPVAGTPTDTVYDTVRRPTFLLNGSSDNVNLASRAGDALSYDMRAGQDDEVNNKEYHAALFSAKEYIATSALTAIRMFSGDVKDEINVLIEKLDVALDAALRTSDDEFDIIIKDVPELLSDRSIVNYAYHKANSQKPAPKQKVGLPLMSTEDLISIIKTKYPASANKIDDHFANIDLKELNTGIKAVLGTQGHNSPEGKALKSWDAYTKLDILTVLYLAVNAYKNNPPEDYRALELNDYNAALTSQAEYLGGLLVTAFANAELHQRSETVIIDFNKKNKTIKVAGSNYREFLKGAGSPEVIIGRVIAKNNASTKPQLEKNAMAFSSAYTRFHQLEIAKREKQKSVITRTVLMNVFTLTYTQEPSDYEKEFHDENGSGELPITKAREIISEFTDVDLMDIGHCAMVLVTKARFFFTDAYQFLVDMEEASKADADITPEGAAMLAAIEYITRYLAETVIYNKA